ncbi:MAG: RNase P subunit p30 family protein [Candidatus Bathyarchaeia archaeon]
MRRFIDLHLRPPIGGFEELERMLHLASELGYSGVAVAAGRPLPRPLMDLCEGRGLDLISRIDLRPRSAGELTAQLRRVRRRFEAVAVECLTKAVARQAARDHRVDLLDFPSSVSTRGRVRFDRPEAVLASGSNCAYEINVSDILRRGPTAAAKLLSIMRREIENARRHEVPVVASSGADSPMMMREPRGLAALLHLVAVGGEEGLEMVSSTPRRLVEENVRKLGPGFIAPGVRVVGRGAR